MLDGQHFEKIQHKVLAFGILIKDHKKIYKHNGLDI